MYIYFWCNLLLHEPLSTVQGYVSKTHFYMKRRMSQVRSLCECLTLADFVAVM